MSDTLETIDRQRLAQVSGGFGPQLTSAMRLARQMGLRVVTGGTNHVKGSYHFRGRAADVYGSRAALTRLYHRLSGSHPTELFYNHAGTMKNGRALGHPVKNHWNHLHVAY